MKFILDNIGYIILGVCAWVVIWGDHDSPESKRRAKKESELREEAWLHSKENPDNEDQFPLG